MTSKSTLDNLIAFLDNPDPAVEEVEEVFRPLTVGDYDDVHIAALLTAIRTRGETFADLLGAARVFLEAGRPFPITGKGIIDTAGTGGDGLNTINITTGASLVAAAGGVKMIKVGNRSVSSKSGSADVLEEMKIPLDLDPDRAVRQFEASNFTFLFAPAYNPAVSHVQPVRRALKVPTLFNTLGPVLAPARPEFQVMGVANRAVADKIIRVLRELGRSRALVFHGSGSDEIAVWGPTDIWELTDDGEILDYTITPEDLGLATYPVESLAGGDAKENAEYLYRAFDGSGPESHRAAIAASAGSMLYTTGMSASLRDGVDKAMQLLSDGTVSSWLTRHEGADYAH